MVLIYQLCILVNLNLLDIEAPKIDKKEQKKVASQLTEESEAFIDPNNTADKVIES